MADETKPLEHLAETERAMDAPESQPVEMSAGERLRAFEDAMFGDDAPRHEGAIEKGSGSPFSAMPDEHKAHHAAIEALTEAETEHQKASAAEDAAHARLEAAIRRVNETEPE